MITVRVIDPPDNADLALVNARRTIRGQTALVAAMRWTCQHSCPEETIAACQRFDCEGTLVEDDSLLVPERDAIQHGDLTACKALHVAVYLAHSECDISEVIPAIERYAGREKLQLRMESASDLGLPGIRLEGPLLAFAELSQIHIKDDVTDLVSHLLWRVELALRRHFAIAGPVLFGSRVVERRTNRDTVGEVIELSALGEESGRSATRTVVVQYPPYVYLGWSGRRRNRRRAYPEVGEAGVVFEAPARARYHPYGLGAEPGQYLGPEARVVVHVNADIASAVAELAQAWLARAAGHPATMEAFDGLLQEITRLIGLEVPHLSGGTGEVAITRSVRYVRRLLISLPIGGGA